MAAHRRGDHREAGETPADSVRGLSRPRRLASGWYLSTRLVAPQPGHRLDWLTVM